MLILVDDESEPTIQCSKCRKWHHQDCVGSESTTRSFTCPNCPRTKPNGESSHVIIPPEEEALSSFAMLKQTDSELEETIIVLRKSLYLRPVPHPNRHISLNHLGRGLWARFQRTRSMTDLAEALSLYRESLSLCPTSHPNRFWLLADLALVILASITLATSGYYLTVSDRYVIYAHCYTYVITYSLYK